VGIDVGQNCIELTFPNNWQLFLCAALPPTFENINGGENNKISLIKSLKDDVLMKSSFRMQASVKTP
jgi:hypothetical protein